MAWTVDGLSYNYRKRITLPRPSSGLSNYPAAVQIVADSAIGGRCLSSGNDLRFTDESGTLLYTNNGGFSVAGGAATGLFYVGQIGSIPSTSDTYIYVYYGNATASAQTGGTGVWPSDYRAVFHLNETGFNYLDATSNGRNMTTGTAPSRIAGPGGGYAQSFTAASKQYLQGAQVLGTSAWSMSGWVKGSNADAYAPFDCRAYTGAGPIIYTDASTGKATYYVAGPGKTLQGSTDLRDDAWHQIVGTYDGSYLRLYVDGDLKAGPTAAVYSGSLPSYSLIGIGYDGGPPPSTGRTAKIAACRANSSALSAAWIAYDRQLLGVSGGGLAWGAEESASTVNPYLLYPIAPLGTRAGRF